MLLVKQAKKAFLAILGVDLQSGKQQKYRLPNKVADGSIASPPPNLNPSQVSDNFSPLQVPEGGYFWHGRICCWETRFPGDSWFSIARSVWYKSAKYDHESNRTHAECTVTFLSYPYLAYGLTKSSQAVIPLFWRFLENCKLAKIFHPIIFEKFLSLQGF